MIIFSSQTHGCVSSFLHSSPSCVVLPSTYLLIISPFHFVPLVDAFAQALISYYLDYYYSFLVYPSQICLTNLLKIQIRFCFLIWLWFGLKTSSSWCFFKVVFLLKDHLFLAALSTGKLRFGVEIDKLLTGPVGKYFRLCKPHVVLKKTQPCKNVKTILSLWVIQK